MPFKPNNKDLKSLLHPYTFALKAGKGFNKDMLDYSLMMLQVSCPETIKSPPYYSKLKQELGILTSSQNKKKVEQKKPRPLPPMQPDI